MGVLAGGRYISAMCGAQEMSVRQLKAELTALCATANYPPCAVDDLKDEL